MPACCYGCTGWELPAVLNFCLEWEWVPVPAAASTGFCLGGCLPGTGASMGAWVPGCTTSYSGWVEQIACWTCLLGGLEQPNLHAACLTGGFLPLCCSGAWRFLPWVPFWVCRWNFLFILLYIYSLRYIDYCRF